MIAIWLSPLYIAGAFFAGKILRKWFGDCFPIFNRRWFRILVAVTDIALALMIPVGFLLPASDVKYALLHYGNIFLGTLLYAVGIILSIGLIRFLLYKSLKDKDRNLYNLKARRITGCVGAACIAFVCIYGFFNALNIRTTNYEVTIETGTCRESGQIDSLRVVLIADLHMGYNIGCDMISDMVDKINAVNPDLVVFAGDIFDNDFDALENPQRLTALLKSIKSKYGSYACFGNHDIDEKILAGFTFDYKAKKTSDPRMDKMLSDAGITLLTDESVTIADSVTLYGRPDRTKPGRDVDIRKKPVEIMTECSRLPVIVLDHEPNELKELSEAGADLVLCGHTHAGQFFPLNLTSLITFENSYGLKQFGKTGTITTSGVGLFGPCLRIGTISEICVIDVSLEYATQK